MIEIKKTRDRRLGNKKLAEELIIDKERYRTNQDCRTLIAFVYDPDKKVTNPLGFESDLSQPITNEDSMVVKVIVNQG